MRRIVLIATTALAAPAFLASCASKDTAAPATVAEAPPPAPVAPPAPPKPRPQLGSFGFDAAGMDASIAPGNDFYGFANGTWLKNTPIPADKSNYGMFTALDDLSKDRVRGIIEGLKGDPSNKIGMAYASYLDTATVEAKGLAPIQPWLDKVRAIKTKKDYLAMVVEGGKIGVRGPVGGYVGQDDKIPENYILTMGQGGTGMPDRDMYLVDNDKMKKVRAAYVAHLANLLKLAGEKDADKRAAAIMALETKIAKVQWTREDSSDAAKTYNKFTVAQTAKLSSATLDLPAMLKATSPKITEVLINQPTAFKGIAGILDKTPMAVLKDQMLVRSLDGLSNFLPDAVANETFAFFGTMLQGTPQREERWKRGVGFVEGTLGEEVGKEYAARYFPPEYKEKMNELVKNVLDAMGRRIDGLSWMQPQTKERAKAKLKNFTVKVGYPDRWRDYSGLEIKADDLFGNAIRSNQFDYEYELGKLGGPVRRWEWGMLPQTVNAYANFGMMEVVFPAAILQPPFFDPNADPAVNYGGIGAVIGHEISHHFDDQGAKYNEKGELSDWWTPEDVKAFGEATKALVAQYDAYEPLPGEHVKGEFTLGENIGDLAGLTIAYDAYKHSLGGQTAPVIDGYSGDQRFFLGWAQVWRRNYRDANLSGRLLTDPHSPSQYRAWVVRNLDAWYDAFAPEPGQAMFLAPAQRVRIW
ncbi:M13 family metallopeptidase [Sphingomonas canadensis]|uniref:M13 family metallopeptidase n=1 Tax=Sphingomonas canadensis TaxID=1219257 RepID=A0ABW3HCC1_9SPHN|nr:M13 family metallopeptidase [Sphingomonas canadensis]MCW3836891.1 M13 family metallopeptidase [Sphingomonas canadensis]